MAEADGIAVRVERMIGDVTARIGHVRPLVEAAFRAAPRHMFIPPVALVAGEEMVAIDRTADPGAWLDAVYSESPIVTQLDDGRTPLRDVIDDGGAVRVPPGTDYTSSNSAPATVADLLNLLNPKPGHRVLEVGTGTGWTAALLSHIVGAGNVTSVEVDAAVAEQAAKNLGEAGVQPHLVVGDGADGCLERAPFDRVHVTCGVRRVPYAWVGQCRPGGVIVLPWCPNFGENHALRLVVTPDGVAHGRFPRFASYMMMRSQRSAHQAEGAERCSRTPVDPRTIAYAPAGADLAVAAITGLRSTTTYLADGGFRLWLHDPDDGGRWARVTWEAGRQDFEVVQAGDRSVWEEVVEAYFRWVEWGEPDRDRFGMTVRPDGRRVWLDTPERVIA